MEYEMKLQPAPYGMIESGRKTIELRLYDEKRQGIKVGDTIVFTHTEDPERKLRTMVTALHQYPSFRELFEALPMTICGYEADTTAEEAIGSMRRYYTESKEAQYGVLGIEIRVEA